MAKNPGIFARLFSKLTKGDTKTPEENIIEHQANDIVKTSYDTDITKFKSGCLEVISASEKGKIFELKSPVIYIGKPDVRRRKNWISVNSPAVSGEQAVIKWIHKDNKFGIVHNESAVIPTLVNEIPVSDEMFTLLLDDDIINIDNIEMRLKYNNEMLDMSYSSGNELEEEFDSPPVRTHDQKEKIKPKSKDTTAEIAFKEAHMFQVVNGPDKEQVFTISKDMVEDKLIIGKKGRKRKDIELSDEGISDCFASLTFENDWLVINLEDEKGDILINDLSIKKKGLEEGDVIKFSNTIMEYYLTGTEISHKYAELEIIEGFDRGKAFQLKGKLIRIGRMSEEEEEKNEIALSEEDKSISRQHAIIEKKGNKFYLVNKKEKNVTLLNGVQVTGARPLVNGDKIKMGKETVFLYKYIGAPLLLRDEQAEITQGMREEISEVKKEEINEKASDSGLHSDDMIFIPGGSFWMGTDDMEQNDIRPKHKIQVEPFYIDRYAVNNIQYADFVRLTGYTSEGNWQEYFTDGKEHYPVVGLTYNDALAYAEWLGKRLPSEAEWEKAARGEEGQLYPWGNIWDGTKLCSKDSGSTGSCPVNSHPDGQSPYGVVNMLGNVWEWTCDHYSNYPYKPSPVEALNIEVIIRGGDWLTEVKTTGAALRGGIFPDEYVASVGFRCARNAAPGVISP